MIESIEGNVFPGGLFSLMKTLFGWDRRVRLDIARISFLGVFNKTRYTGTKNTYRRVCHFDFMNVSKGTRIRFYYTNSNGAFGATWHKLHVRSQIDCGFDIDKLCIHMKYINNAAACRLCLLHKLGERKNHIILLDIII